MIQQSLKLTDVISSIEKTNEVASKVRDKFDPVDNNKVIFEYIEDMINNYEIIKQVANKEETFEDLIKPIIQKYDGLFGTVISHKVDPTFDIYTIKILDNIKKVGFPVPSSETLTTNGRKRDWKYFDMKNIRLKLVTTIGAVLLRNIGTTELSLENIFIPAIAGYIIGDLINLRKKNKITGDALYSLKSAAKECDKYLAQMMGKHYKV